MGVCAHCICDFGLKEQVLESLTEYECEYCGQMANDPIACNLGEITKYMMDVIDQEYCDPADELPYESAEGGYQGQYFDAYELFEEIGFTVENDRLLHDLVRPFIDQHWCRRHYFSTTPGDRHRWGWEKFCSVVKTQRRYTFWADHGDDRSEYDDEALHPAEMLPRLAEIMGEYQCTVEPGARFWRVRVLDEDSCPISDKFTSPPTKCARISNRMSPAGVSMFYGAAELLTAYEEVVDPNGLSGKKVWGVQFENIVPLTFLDLTALPDPPSYFSPRGYRSQDEIRFLQFFRREISKPITRDNIEHIEYVPTQVLTEYVRYEMKNVFGGPFHGIIYPSSKTEELTYVIFADQRQCLATESIGMAGPLLNIVWGSLRECGVLRRELV